jgi:hypothetical protein
MYFLTRNTIISLNKIAEILNCGDHTTVIHGRDNIQEQLSIKNEVVLYDVQQIYLMTEGEYIKQKEYPSRAEKLPILGTKVIDIDTDKVYRSIFAASKEFGYNYQNLYYALMVTKKHNHLKIVG